MKLFQIEDRPARRAFTPSLCEQLNRLSGWEWSDGFGAAAATAWHDADCIIEALSAHDGVILLDIELEDGGLPIDPNQGGVGLCEIARRKLVAHLESKKVPYSQFMVPELEMFTGPKAELSTLILAAALALDRHVLIASRMGFPARATEHIAIGHIVLPEPGVRKENVPEIIAYCAKKIWEEVGGISKAEQRWNLWARAEVGRDLLFPATTDPETNFHGVGSWLDPERASKRPVSAEAMIGEAENLLQQCGIANVRLDYPAAVRTLKAAVRNKRHLAVAVVESLLGLKVRVAEGMAPLSLNAPALVCRQSAGRALLALANLHSSEPDHVSRGDGTAQSVPVRWDFQLRMDQGSSFFVVVEYANFGTSEAAADAAMHLRSTPNERQFRLGRLTKGSATQARYWLQNEASDGDVVVDGSWVILWFEFPAVDF